MVILDNKHFRITALEVMDDRCFILPCWFIVEIDDHIAEHHAYRFIVSYLSPRDETIPEDFLDHLLDAFHLELLVLQSASQRLDTEAAP